jgi:hypothetical protein
MNMARKRPTPNVQTGDIVTFYGGRKVRLTVERTDTVDGVRLAYFSGEDGTEHSAPFSKLEVLEKNLGGAK